MCLEYTETTAFSVPEQCVFLLQVFAFMVGMTDDMLFNFLLHTGPATGCPASRHPANVTIYPCSLGIHLHTLLGPLTWDVGHMFISSSIVLRGNNRMRERC
jgi:hypothetical protein